MEIKKFVMFLGPVRSGHTFVSSLLSAHPKISISLELQPIKKVVRYRYDKEKLFNEILVNCKKRKKMEMGGYNYYFSKSQNKIDKTEIIGDSISGRKQNRLVNKNLNIFSDIIDVPIKWIIAYKHPYSVISSIYEMRKDRYGETIGDAINHYIEIFGKSKEIMGKEEVKNNMFIYYHESFCKNPKKYLTEMCDFLEVTPTEKYLMMCTKQVKKKPSKFNPRLWSVKEIYKVRDFIEKTPELYRYYHEL